MANAERTQNILYKAEASSESEIFEAPDLERIHEAPDGHVARFG